MIDWISVSLKNAGPPPDTQPDRIEKELFSLAASLLPGVAWSGGTPQKPFSVAIESTIATLNYGNYLSGTGDCLLTVNGTQCAAAGDAVLLGLIRDHAENVTRLDIAYDIETGVLPGEFCAPGLYTPRMTKDGRECRTDIVSGTGNTTYIGDRKNPLFARVYRYREPHPRAHLLRIEYELKGDYSRNVSQKIREGTTVQQVAVNLGERFGWLHSAYNPTKTPEPMPLYSKKERAGSDIWLRETVVTFLAKRILEGEFTPDELLSWIEQKQAELAKPSQA